MRPRFSRSTPLFLIPLLTALALHAVPAQGQEGRFSVAVLLGTTGAGPGEGIGQAFAGEGYRGVKGDCRFSCEEFDMTETGVGVTGVPLLLEAGYRALEVGPADLGLAVQYAMAPIGRTRGSRGERTTQQDADFLYLEYGTTVMGALASVEVLDVLRLGAGAARYTATVSRQDTGKLKAEEKTTRWGPLLEGGLGVRVGYGVRAVARAQYRMVGDVAYGPYAYSELDSTVILPALTADFTHWSAGLGVVVELGG